MSETHQDELKPGDKAPEFKLSANGNREISLKDFEGQKLVLYFYPKDDTPGCTTEACGFNDILDELKNLNAAVVGVSKDSVAKHEKFAGKYGLNFPLLSDEEAAICEAYGVWREKSMYGKTYMGIERSTFLIDERGEIQKVWRKVKVKGHVDEVKSTLTQGEQAA